MDIKNEAGEVSDSPDMSKGRLEERTETVHHEAVEAVEEQGHWITIAEYPSGGKDVEWIVDVEGVEAVEAYTEEIPYHLYIPYTEEELAERAAAQAAAQEASKTAQSLADSAALALAQKLATATTLAQVRSYANQIAQEYADKTDAASQEAEN